MGILIFIVVLVVLILVHEFGHFVVAKLFGMRVDEFGIGYPPRLWGIRRGETLYSVNALPFGGFVKIHGEDGEEKEAGHHTNLVGVVAGSSKQEVDLRTNLVGGGAEESRAFSEKPRILQALVLFAGIAMNLIFAWLLISVVLWVGYPRTLSGAEALQALDARITIQNVLPGSPAETAGLLPGDTLLKASSGEDIYEGLDAAVFTDFIAEGGGGPITLTIVRGGETLSLTATPQAGVVPNNPERVALGVGVTTIGTLPLAPLAALKEGVVATANLTRDTAVALTLFLFHALTLSADFSQIAGPVGIASVVGSASETGLVNLLFLTAIISINLALVNLIPIPALDGGRLLFVAIESVIRRRIKPTVARAFNTVGFALLILLMVVVTANDIIRLVT